MARVDGVADIRARKPSCRSSLALLLVSTLVLASCATSSHVLVGPARPAILPNDVAVLLSAPGKFEQIAELEASSGASLQSSEAKWDRAVEELKKEAASVGANAIVLDIPDDDGAGTVSAGASKPVSDGDGKPIEVGLGASSNRTPLSQSLRALAIYVPE
jgi:hypothetical protein